MSLKVYFHLKWAKHPKNQEPQERQLLCVGISSKKDGPYFLFKKKHQLISQHKYMADVFLKEKKKKPAFKHYRNLSYILAGFLLKQYYDEKSKRFIFKKEYLEEDQQYEKDYSFVSDGSISSEDHDLSFNEHKIPQHHRKFTCLQSSDEEELNYTSDKLSSTIKELKKKGLIAFDSSKFEPSLWLSDFEKKISGPTSSYIDLIKYFLDEKSLNFYYNYIENLNLDDNWDSFKKSFKKFIIHQKISNISKLIKTINNKGEPLKKLVMEKIEKVKIAYPSMPITDQIRTVIALFEDVETQIYFSKETFFDWSKFLIMVDIFDKKTFQTKLTENTKEINYNLYLKKPIFDLNRQMEKTSISNLIETASQK